MTRRLVAALLFTVGGGAAVSSALTARFSDRTLSELGARETTSFGEILAYELTRNYELTDERGLTGFIQGVRVRRPEATHIRVVGPDGKIIASSDEAEVGHALGDGRLPAALRGEPTPALERDGKALSVLVPLRVGRGKELPRGILAVEQTQEALRETYRKNMAASGAMGLLVSLLVALGLGLFIDRRIHDPIRQLALAARRVAARDLTARLPPPTSNDELSDLIVAFGAATATTRSMVEQLRNLAAALDAAGRDVGEAAREIRQGAAGQRETALRTADRVEGHIGILEQLGTAAREAVERADRGGRAALDIAGHSNQLVRVGETAAKDVESSVTAINEVSAALLRIVNTTAAVRKVSNNATAHAERVHHSSSLVQTDADEAARLAAQLAEDARRGDDAVKRVLEAIGVIDERIRTVDHHVERLDPALNQIVGIARMVAEIADQTRVLSLNASILAARAGEAGSGFKVVAERVRELSVRTRASADEIATLVGSVEQTAPAVLETVRKSRESVDQGVTLVENATASIEAIQTGAAALRSATARIVTTATGQADAARQLLAAASATTDRIDQLSEAAATQRDGAERLEKAGAALRAASREVDTKARLQERLADGIVSDARTDAVRLRNLGQAALDGVESSRSLSNETSEIVEVSSRHSHSVDRFEKVITVLSRETDALSDELASFHLPTDN